MHEHTPWYDVAPQLLVRQVARARKPSYLEITAVLAAVGAVGLWFGAMLL